MNRQTLIKTIAAETELPPETVIKAVQAICDVIIDEVAAGEEVKIINFGIFFGRVRAAREAINPQTGERMPIREVRVPIFKPSKIFKRAIKES